MLFFIYRLLKPESVFIASSTKTYLSHTLLYEWTKTNLKLLSPQHETINSSMVRFKVSSKYGCEHCIFTWSKKKYF